MKPIRVVLGDDHELMRAGIRSLIKELDQVEVVGEAGNGRDCLRLVETLRPDVVLMDIMMPEMNGLDATARIVSKHPNVRVIILSMNASEEHVLQALRAGASGYLLKNIGPAELAAAIREVSQGDKHITAAVAKHVMKGFLEGGKTSSVERLSPRQREVLQLVAEGNSSKEIARKLNISVKTAEVHRSDLMKALDIHDVASLARYAIRVGLVSPDT
ncbi:LuxR family transcriptional regulator [Planctomycetaceae bacterium SCGC AG-212-D15]|nr:LuxR family transcriptional regulator [Planctomycetaceae bacterium SCGC AG-212-D15]